MIELRHQSKCLKWKFPISFSNLLHEKPKNLLISYPHVIFMSFCLNWGLTPNSTEVFTVKKEDTCHVTFYYPIITRSRVLDLLYLLQSFSLVHTALFLVHFVFLCPSLNYTSSIVKVFHFSELSLFYIVLVIHILKMYTDWLFYQAVLCGYKF